MRALFVVGEGYDGPEAGLELETHPGVAHLSEDDAGPLVRVQLGYADAGSLLRYLRMVFPGAEAHVVGLRCQDCRALATVNLHLLGAEESGHWCDDCVPEERRAEWERNRKRGELPHEKRATVDAVSYYLRSAYGHKVEDVEEMLRVNPYSIATAASRGMTVEACAVDIHRRWSASSARLRLEQAAAADGVPWGDKAK